MTDTIAKAIRSALPGVSVGRAPVSRRGSAVTVCARPEKSVGARRAERVTLRFTAPSYAEARRMYLRARDALVSVGNEAKVGEGARSLVVRETDGGSAGYIARAGLYFITASFTAYGH